MERHRVAITGVNGYVGSVLRDFLLAREDVELVLGIDIQKKSKPAEKYRYIRSDIRSEKLENILKSNGITDIFHFAFILENISDEELMYDINVNGTENLLRAAVYSGARSVTVASSISVFGAWEKHSRVHHEEDIPKPNEGDKYGLHKTIVEGICQKYMAKHPEMRVMIVRFSGVFGPNLKSNLTVSAMRQPFAALPIGGKGAFQVIHENEVAKLCYLAMKKGSSGIYHAAGRDVITMKELYQLLGKKYIYLPFRLLKALAMLATRIKLVVTNSFQLELLRFPVLIDGEATFKRLGFKPLKRATEIIMEFAKTHGLKLKKKE